jgi:glutathione S-transferase
LRAQLVIGNKLYSSWSLRAWLVMKVFDLPFDETVVPLFQASSKQEVLRYSPSGKVPVLIDGDFVVWESMAIIEYLAEIHPLKGIWPSEAAARAHARAASAEMHADFSALRSACPMNLGKGFARRERGEAVAQDVARVTASFARLALALVVGCFSLQGFLGNGCHVCACRHSPGNLLYKSGCSQQGLHGRRPFPSGIPSVANGSLSRTMGDSGSRSR